jgi:outer membrane lipoprotein-sorting protein
MVGGAGSPQLDTPGLSPSQKIDFILSQMAKVQKEARTVAARFTMEKKMALLASPVKAEGILYLTKPDKVYWEVKAPIANTLIVNGKTLWMYYPTLRQVDKVDISGKHRKLVQYLEMSQDGSAIKESYRLRLLESSGGSGLLVVELTPRTTRVGKRISKMKVWVDPETWFINRLDMWEPNGDYSILRLQEVRLNEPVPDSVYDFRPPPGTVVNQPLQLSSPR